MTVPGDAIKRWCQEESLPVVTEQEAEADLACTVTLPGDPPLAVSVRASVGQPGRVLLSHTAHTPLPEEVGGESEAQQRLAALLERVAASRSALVDCRPVQWKGELATEIVVTLHEDGATKQGFLVALEEIRKVRSVLAWELDTMALTVGLVSEVRSRVEGVVERTEALASDAAKAVQEFEASAAALEPASATAVPEPPPPTPAPPPAPAAPSAGGVFCTECGRQARPGARFCNGCGASLEA
jgi:hypothetical protein